MLLSMLPQLLTAGIVSGCIYALVALGLVVVFKATGVINFAHGSIILVGAYLGVSAVGMLGLSYPIAVLLAVAGAAVLGWISYFAVYRKLLAAPHMIQVLSTLAVANILSGGTTFIWGSGSYGFPPSERMRPVLTEPVVITGQQLLIVVSAIIIMAALTAYFRWTRWGKAMRALAENPIGAGLCGIRMDQVFALSITMSAVLGAVAGVLYAPLTLVDPGFSWLLVKGFAAASVGGLASLPGAVVGGLVLGLCESLWVGVLPALWAPSLSYVVIIAVLLIKPAGLFGTPTTQKL